MDDLIAVLRSAIEGQATAARAALERATTSRRMVEGRMVELPISPRGWRDAFWPPEVALRHIQADLKLLEGVERYLDPHPGIPCTNVDADGESTYEPCELHVAAKGRISPEVLPLLAEAYGIEVES